MLSATEQKKGKKEQSKVKSVCLCVSVGKGTFKLVRKRMPH